MSTVWPPFGQPPRKETSSPEVESQWRDTLWKIVKTLMSNSDGQEAVVARAALTTAQTGITNKVIPFNVIAKDTHSGFAAGVYTVKVAGDYPVAARALLSSLDGATDARIQIRKNAVVVADSYGSRLCGGSTASATLGVDDILVSLAVGDTIDIFIVGDASFDMDSGGFRTWVAISRIGGT